MTRLIVLSALVSLCLASTAFGQAKPKRKPDINESKEFPNVFHSPSADATPKVFRSILQMEVIVQSGEGDPKVQYANGVVLSRDGLIVSVVAEPGASDKADGGIQSASILTLDGGGVEAKLVSYDAVYGVAVFRTRGLEVSPLRLSTAPIVANRRVNWHAIFKNGRKTYLYSRPLRVHKSSYSKSDAAGLCEIIDTGSSSLNADRSGSALVSLDGTLLGLMGRQKHWNVTPKNNPPRKKLAWAVPAKVIAQIIEKAEGAE